MIIASRNLFSKICSSFELILNSILFSMKNFIVFIMIQKLRLFLYKSLISMSYQTLRSYFDYNLRKIVNSGEWWGMGIEVEGEHIAVQDRCRIKSKMLIYPPVFMSIKGQKTDLSSAFPTAWTIPVNRPNITAFSRNENIQNIIA